MNTQNKPRFQTDFSPIIFYSLVCILFLTTSSFAQFDSLIFQKKLKFDNYIAKQVYPLGDQNNDGYDDMLYVSCSDKRGYIYFGGNPIDTVAAYSIPLLDSIYTHGRIGIIDINDDGTKDIAMSTLEHLSDIGFYTRGPIRIYFGGERIDSIPNYSFFPPKGSEGGSIQILEDFNHDGRDEFVIFDPNLPFSKKQYGSLYFYNTKTTFDTIPDYTLFGDTLTGTKIHGITTSGDINGDGKADFMLGGSVADSSGSQRFRSIYLGNDEFNLTPDATYYFNGYNNFDPLSLVIINDVNGDGKDDILMEDYGFYPYWYDKAISFGELPIDTIPDVGLNTQNRGLISGELYSLGDVNGDGYNDFFAPSGAGYRDIKLWIGGPNMPYSKYNDATPTKTWYGGGDGFGRFISDIGDMDGDGVNDILIGRILYGSAPNHCQTGWIYIFKGDTSVVGEPITNITNVENYPEKYHLFDPYPNPMNPTTTIKWDMRKAGNVKLFLYNNLGQLISLLTDKYYDIGNHELVIDANEFELSSGVYFAELQIVENNMTVYSETRKINLLK